MMNISIEKTYRKWWNHTMLDVHKTMRYNTISLCFVIFHQVISQSSIPVLNGDVLLHTICVKTIWGRTTKQYNYSVYTASDKFMEHPK